VGELERRYAVAGNPGKIAVTAFLSRGRMGLFSDAIALAEATGAPANTANVRRYHSRPGLSANLEQQISSDVGLFVRAGWADGDVEPFDYSDIDRTLAGGLSVSGRRWGRPNDSMAIGAALNQISRIHQAYLADGGLGILVGDGRLPHPEPESIVESYYDIALPASVHLTLDGQGVFNPAYNRDRGPAAVLAARLHVQY